VTVRPWDRGGRTHDSFDATHLPVDQSNLNSVGMMGRSGEKIFDHPSGQSTGSLICFHHDVDFDAWSNVFLVLSIQESHSFMCGIEPKMMVIGFEAGTQF